MLAGQEKFDPARHSFRIIFKDKIRFRDGWDVFTVFVVIFGVTYIVLYYFLLPPVCRP